MITAAIGNASRTPVKPNNSPPARIAKITATGCRPIRSPTNNGVSTIQTGVASGSIGTWLDTGGALVEQAADVLPIERTGAFRGRYHVLGGRLSPLDNIGPAQLRIAGLRARVERHVDEVILALGSDVEGEATCHFLHDHLAGCGARLTRLAQGLPAGGGLESADTLTVMRALSGRREMDG